MATSKGRAGDRTAVTNLCIIIFSVSPCCTLSCSWRFHRNAVRSKGEVNWLKSLRRVEPSVPMALRLLDISQILHLQAISSLPAFSQQWLESLLWFPSIPPFLACLTHTRQALRQSPISPQSIPLVPSHKSPRTLFSRWNLLTSSGLFAPTSGYNMQFPPLVTDGYPVQTVWAEF